MTLLNLCCRKSRGVTFIDCSPFRRRTGRVPENRSTDPHHRGAFLDGHFEIVAHAHRKLGQAGLGNAFPESRSRGSRGAEPGAHVLWVFGGAEQEHRPTSRAAGAILCRIRPPHLLRLPIGRPRPPGPPAQADGSFQFGGRAIDPTQQVQAVDRLDAANEAAAFFALFDCRWPTRCQ